jgi:cell division protein ZipA
MPELRWILTVFGLLLLIGIYAWGRRSSKAAPVGDDSLVRSRPEPGFETRPAYEPPDFEASEPAGYVDEESQTEYSPTEERAVPVRAVPVRTQTFGRPSIIGETDEETVEAVVRPSREPRYARIEPTFNEESVTAELPAREDEPIETVESRSTQSQSIQLQSGDAPTLSMSSTPQPRRIERRKIIALRLAAGPQRLAGAQLQAAFESESLQHGRYDVFHRLDEHGAAIFSVASMVEPGTFNLEKMSQETFTGITMFTQLPGPAAGMLAFNELIACSRRLHAALGGTLQDERGVPLTVHRVERMRQEVREFEQRPASEAQRSNTTLSHTPP